MPDHSIIVERVGDSFHVEVVPPHNGEAFDRIEPTHKAARGWAVGLRLTHGWPIDDRAQEMEARI